MDDMQFAKYSSDIREVLSKAENNPDALDNLIRNVVAYVVSENNNKTNWLALELFADVLENEDIIDIFDEE